MSTYLTLANDLARECGKGGSSSAISAVTGQSGQAYRIVEWVQRSWTDIQNRHANWKWLRSRFTVNTTSGDDTYAGTDCTDAIASAVITRFKNWWPWDDEGCSNVTIYLTSGGVSGERHLIFMPWHHFRTIYKFGTQNNGAPVHFTIDPQNNLVLGPKPDGIYTVQGEYQKSAQVLAADADTPEVHSDYHDLIVWFALEKYAKFSASPESLTQAKRESARMMRQLEKKELPAIGFGPPLA